MGSWRSVMSVVKTKIEKWDQDVARTISLLEDTPVEVVRAIRKALAAGHGRQVQVSYAHGKKTPGEGRLHASGPSLQTLPGWVRRLVAGKRYHDVDLVNAEPTLLLGLAADVEVPALHHYVTEREAVLAELIERNGIDRATAKKAVIATLNFGDYHRVIEKEDDDAFLESLQGARGKLCRYLMAVEPALYAACSKEDGNVRGRFMAHVYLNSSMRRRCSR